MTSSDLDVPGVTARVVMNQGAPGPVQQFLVRYRCAFVCSLLIVSTIILYWPVHNHQFVNYDDAFYVTENTLIRQGLSWHGVAMAFSGRHAANWHPITTLSHMVDCQFFGLRPGWHHIENAIWHAVNAGLLFLVLREMTKSFWPSAFVAALFAWHPLHVESVAWVAERKDLLSTLFFLLALAAYLPFVRSREGNPAAMEGRIRGGFFYLLALAFFALGLMSKPMLVTFPFVLLLLDLWPLRRVSLPLSHSSRFGQARPFLACNSGIASSKVWIRLIAEKLPFFILSAVVSAVTFSVQAKSGAMKMQAHLSLAERSANAFISCARYTGKILWPHGLAVFYPLPLSWPAWQVIGAIVLVVALSLIFVRCWAERPFFLVGWLWFLGTLVPVLGFVQVGGQAMADRYMYIPSIGLFICVAWEAAEQARRRPRSAVPLATMGGIVLAGLMLATRVQLRYWTDSEALFRHALNCTTESPVAHYNLGCALVEERQFDEAILHFQSVLRLDSTAAEAHVNLGVALQAQGRSDAATSHFAAAVKLTPGNTAARNNLGLLLAQQSKTNEAALQFTEALRTNPDYPEAHYNFASLLAQQGDRGAATTHYRAALRSKPDYAEAHYQLAVLCSAGKEYADAIVHFRHAIRLKPDWIEALNNLAWVLATATNASVRNGPEALRLASRVVELTQTNNAGALDTLAAALAESGRFNEAANAVTQALALAESNGLDSLTNELRAHEKLYLSGRPLRE